MVRLDGREEINNGIHLQCYCIVFREVASVARRLR